MTFVTRFLMSSAVLTAAALAQNPAQSGEADRMQPRDSQPQVREVRRLESVSWNPVNGELTWVVSRGPSAKDLSEKNTYVIRIDEALMKFEGERRGFDPQEARSVHSLLNLLSRYAVESTIWWEEGKGVKLDDAKPGLRASLTPPPPAQDAKPRQ